MGRFRIRLGLRFLGFAIIFVGLAGLAVMVLWNALLPTIVGVSTITFGQALGLLLLSRILFGGLRGYGPRGYNFGRGGRRRGTGWDEHGHGRAEWKQKMVERWQQLTPEQREQMKGQWRARCGHRGHWNAPPPEQPGQTDSATAI